MPTAWGTWFLPAVAAFAQKTSHLANIVIDDEDHTADWLRTGRVVAAVTAPGQRRFLPVRIPSRSGRAAGSETDVAE